MTNSRRRVVITGMGVMSPLGKSVEDYWSGLTEQEKCLLGIIKILLRQVTRFQRSDLPLVSKPPGRPIEPFHPKIFDCRRSLIIKHNIPPEHNPV